MEVETDLEMLICMQAPVEYVLRRLILDQTYSDFNRREIVQTYGFEYFIVMEDMKDVGLFKKRMGLPAVNVIKPFLDKKPIIYFLGGCTYDELHVLQKMGVEVKTTSMITGNSFIQSFFFNYDI